MKFKELGNRHSHIYNKKKAEVIGNWWRFSNSPGNLGCRANCHSFTSTEIGEYRETVKINLTGAEAEGVINW